MAQNFHALFIATVSMLCATRIKLIISKDLGKTCAAKALRLWDFRNLFCIFLALLESIKINRALSSLTIVKYRPSSIKKKLVATLASYVLIQRSFVLFKNVMILFWSIQVIYGSWKSWSVVFNLKDIKTILNSRSWIAKFDPLPCISRLGSMGLLEKFIHDTLSSH